MEMKDTLTEFKQEEYKEFFAWLFAKSDIEIEKEIDVSKCLEYSEPYIYYTPEIKAFFETSPMKRIGKIGQLVNISLGNPSAGHTRLDHCKGAYQKILEFYMRQFQKENWKTSHSSEEERLKVLADIMDMASHDIGHNVCSHALENLIASYKGAHEVLGNRILHENPEVIEAFNNIHPKLLDNIDIVKQENYSLHPLKEGSIDFDRADFLIRDSVYLGVEAGFDDINGDNDSITQIIDRLMDGCEIYTIKRDGKSIEVPVFSYEVEPEIEEFLQRRADNYENIYGSIENKPIDIMLETFCNCLIAEDDTNSELTDYLRHISSTSIENIDLDKFVSWNDIRFYNSLFDIIDKTQNENLRELAKSCLPRKESIITVVYERLFPKITPKIDENGNEVNIEDEFDEEDRKFYLKVRDIVKYEACCKKYLKYDGMSEDKMSVSFDTEAQRDEFLNQLHTGFEISEEESISVSKKAITSLISWKKKIKKYDRSEPIFIRGADDKIYTFDEYPGRKMDIYPIEYYGVLSIEEKMHLDGVSDDEIQKCKFAFNHLRLIQNRHSKVEMMSEDTKMLGELKDIAARRVEEDEERYA